MVNVCGIEVDFPFEPYECQKIYMEKVITCVQNGVNGVLESPTGTGKTLCLLCATLAWRETYGAKVQFDQLQGLNKVEKSKFNDRLNIKLGGAIGPGDNSEIGKSNLPKIIYASRTHSQISQVIKELKNTNYKPSMCVLGSREQMCINSEVMKEESNNGKVHMCRVKVANKQCYYYNNLEINKSTLSPGIRDIEDLVAEGTEKKFCPYYMSREINKQADLTFMPYNYILDFKARKAHSIDLSNSIVILDEGHNVESVCEDNMSFDFTSFDLASCVDDCQQCIEALMQKEEVGYVDDNDFKCELTAEDASLMKALFLQLESVIGEVVLDKNNCATKSASFLLDELGKLNINSLSRDQIVDTIEQMCGLLAASTSKVFKAKNYALDKFSTILRTIFSKEEDRPLVTRNTQKFYKVHIQAEKVQDKNKQNKLDLWTRRSSSSKETPRTLSYWCFHPGLTMRELMDQGVRSLILTSGTLSPLSSFKSELDIPFNVELENTHVIEKYQVFVAIIPQGPDGKRLNSSYQFRSTPEYQVSLGNTIVNVARIIPNGLLVFFPSYAVMDIIISKWQECGIWDRLSTSKGLFIEPRRKGILNETMAQYYEKVNDPKLKGALFFAVCRGKVSEGLDFADANGRAVIITGLPFPPSQDPKVILKKQFLDEQKDKLRLSGKDWYRQQASRAVNQAIGRVIRHKFDYGAILLCDERFCYAEAKSHLPSWIKQQVREYKDFGMAQRDLAIFFKNILPKMGVTEDLAESKRKLGSIYNENDKEYTEVKAKVVRLNDKCSTNPSLCSKSNIPGSLNSIATTSLTQLDSSSLKKPSLFDSLKEQETEAKSNQLSFDTLSSKLPHEMDSSSSSSRGKSKKYKIVKSSSSDDNKVDSKQKTCKPNNHNDNETQKKDKLQRATQYLKTLKTELSVEKYSKFSEALNLYKRSKNINVLLLQFEDIYDMGDPHHIELLKKFSIFIRENDKRYFMERTEKCSTLER